MARLLGATYDGEAFPFDPCELRVVDVAMSDDMLQCLEARRRERADLHVLAGRGDTCAPSSIAAPVKRRDRALDRYSDIGKTVDKIDRTDEDRHDVKVGRQGVGATGD